MIKETPPSWLIIAEKELGIHEVPGKESNDRIIQYHSCTSLKATSDEVPWCSSFVNWVFREAGMKITHSAAARSWLGWGELLTKPKFGCVVILRRGDNPSAAHVGFYVGEGTDHVKVLGGNQSDKVCILNFKKKNVISYRWPKEKSL